MDNHLQSMQEQDPSITSIPALDRQQLIDQAKSFFFCSKTGHIFNLDDYEQWKLHSNVDDKGKNVDKIEPKIQEIASLFFQISKTCRTHRCRKTSSRDKRDS